MKDFVKALAVLAVLYFFYYLGYSVEHKNSERLSANQEILLNQLDSCRLDSSKHASEVKLLNLTVDELKSANTYLAKQAADLGADLKRMRSASASVYSNKTSVTASVAEYVYKDTIAHDTVYEVIDMVSHNFNYTDGYTTVTGSLLADTIHMDIDVRDTIINTITYEPKRLFWGLIKYGKKFTKSTVYNKNPNAYITVIEAVEVTNKKRTKVNGD